MPIITINEIAWMGTLTSANDEWIELSNNAPSPANLDGWVLKAGDGSPKINLMGTIPAQGFWLLERTDDNSVTNISADQIYTGALNNKGEKLELYDNSGNLIDFADGSAGWPAGDNATKQTMSRIDLNQWKSSKEPGGTPKAPNTFATAAPQEEDNAPSTQPGPVLDKKDVAVVSEIPETSPQKNKESAAVGEQTTKSSFFLLIAGGLAILSGITILILKKVLK